MAARVNWLLLTNAVLGQFLAGLSARVFMISLPTVANGLGSDILGIAWALISFQLAGISLSIVFGRLGDIYGRGMVHTAFDLGHMLGVSVGGLLLTIAFQYYSGISEATPDPRNPFAFVSSMNASYVAAMGLGLVALFTSFMRGGGKIQAAAKTAH